MTKPTTRTAAAGDLLLRSLPRQRPRQQRQKEEENGWTRRLRGLFLQTRGAQRRLAATCMTTMAEQRDVRDAVPLSAAAAPCVLHQMPAAAAKVA